MKTTGKVTGIVSNLVTVEVNGPVSQNELCYITVGDTKLMAEVIKVNGRNAAVQVFESTRGLKNGNDVEFEDKMLEATLGPVRDISSARIGSLHCNCAARFSE